MFARESVPREGGAASGLPSNSRLAPSVHSLRSISGGPLTFNIPQEEFARKHRISRDQASAEYAISVISCLLEPPPGLLAAALSVASRSAVAVGESISSWRARTQLRYGADIFERAGQDSALVEKSQSVSRQLLAEHGYGGFAQTPDPLSNDPRTDIPAMLSPITVGLTAGITDVRVPLRLLDGWPVLSAEVDILVELHATQRGAHMSRLQEAVIAQATTEHTDAVAFAIQLAARAAASQVCSSATVTVRVDQQPPITSAVTGGRSSLNVTSTVTVAHDGQQVGHSHTSLAVQIMTACPCTIAYSRLASERQSGRIYGPDMPPTFTHSQPGTLEVGVTAQGGPVIASTDLLTAVRSTAVLREAVLKRPDEHELVERAHRRPQFTEDVTRGAAAAVACRVPADAIVSASASLAESIHPHRATATLRVRAADLQAAAPSVVA